MNLQPHQQSDAQLLRSTIDALSNGYGDAHAVKRQAQQLAWSLGGGNIDNMPLELVTLYLLSLVLSQP